MRMGSEGLAEAEMRVSSILEVSSNTPKSYLNRVLCCRREGAWAVPPSFTELPYPHSSKSRNRSTSGVKCCLTSVAKCGGSSFVDFVPNP